MAAQVLIEHPVVHALRAELDRGHPVPPQQAERFPVHRVGPGGNADAPERAAHKGGGSLEQLEHVVPAGGLVKLPPKKAISASVSAPASARADSAQSAATDFPVGASRTPEMLFWLQKLHCLGQPAWGTKIARFACLTGTRPSAAAPRGRPPARRSSCCRLRPLPITLLLRCTSTTKDLLWSGPDSSTST